MEVVTSTPQLPYSRETSLPTPWIGGFVGPRLDLDACGEKSHATSGNWTPSVQPVDHRFSDWAMPASSSSYCTFGIEICAVLRSDCLVLELITKLSWFIHVFNFAYRNISSLLVNKKTGLRVFWRLWRLSTPLPPFWCFMSSQILNAHVNQTVDPPEIRCTKDTSILVSQQHA
jgi:hypothetical protein